MSFKEVIGFRHDHQLSRLWRQLHYFSYVAFRTKLVARTADKQLWGRAVLQIVICIQAAFSADRRAQRDKACNALVAANHTHTGGRSEGKSAEDKRQLVFAFKPFQGCANIGLLT